MAVVAAVASALPACGAEVSGSAATPPAAPAATNPAAATNIAALDPVATAEVVRDVDTALEAVLSYNSADPAAHQAAAGKHLTGQATEEMRRLFDQVVVQAANSPVTLVSTVVSSAVAELGPDRAVAVAYLDQASTRQDNGQSTSGRALISVVAAPGAEGWRLTELHVPPAVPAKPPAGETGAEAERDSAVRSARNAAEVLTTVDAADVEGTFARWDGVITGTLREQQRAGRQSNRDALTSAGNTTTGRAMAAAATEFDQQAGRATVLVPVETTVVGRDGATQTKQLGFRLTVMRDGADWKADGIEQPPPA